MRHEAPLAGSEPAPAAAMVYLNYVAFTPAAKKQALLTIPKAQILAAVTELESCQRCRFVRHVLAAMVQPHTAAQTFHCQQLSRDTGSPSTFQAGGLDQTAQQTEHMLLPFLAAASTKHRLANLLQFVWDDPEVATLSPGLFVDTEGQAVASCQVKEFLEQALICIQELSQEVGDCSRHSNLPGPADIESTHRRLEAQLQGAASSLQALGVLRAAQPGNSQHSAVHREELEGTRAGGKAWAAAAREAAVVQGMPDVVRTRVRGNEGSCDGCSAAGTVSSSSMHWFGSSSSAGGSSIGGSSAGASSAGGSSAGGGNWSVRRPGSTLQPVDGSGNSGEGHSTAAAGSSDGSAVALSGTASQCPQQPDSCLWSPAQRHRRPHLAHSSPSVRAPVDTGQGVADQALSGSNCGLGNEQRHRACLCSPCKQVGGTDSTSCCPPCKHAGCESPSSVSRLCPSAQGTGSAPPIASASHPPLAPSHPIPNTLLSGHILEQELPGASLPPVDQLTAWDAAGPLEVLSGVDEGVVASLPDDMQARVRALQRELLQLHQRRARLHKAQQHGMEAAARQLLLLLLKLCWERVVRSYHSAQADASWQNLLATTLCPLQQRQELQTPAHPQGEGCGLAALSVGQGLCEARGRGGAVGGQGGAVGGQGGAVGGQSGAVGGQSGAVGGGCACCQGGACCARHLDWELQKLELRDREAELLQELGCVQAECECLRSQLVCSQQEAAALQVDLDNTRLQLLQARDRLEASRLAQQVLQQAAQQAQHQQLTGALGLSRASGGRSSVHLSAPAQQQEAACRTMPDDSELQSMSSSELEELASRHEAVLQRIRAAHIKVAALERDSCPVCWERRRGLVFGCGHSTCSICGERLTSCPICRVNIALRIRMY